MLIIFEYICSICFVNVTHEVSIFADIALRLILHRQQKYNEIGEFSGLSNPGGRRLKLG